MKFREDTFFRAIEAARQEILKTGITNTQNTRNRLADSIGYALDADDKTVGGFFDAWVAKHNGSSALMIASFMRGLQKDPPNEFSFAVDDARAALNSKYGEIPNPIGLMLAFQVVAAMGSQSCDRIIILRHASDVLGLIIEHNRDIGFRCFTAFLKGFAYNL